MKVSTSSTFKQTLGILSLTAIFGAASAFAGETANQTVTFEVQAINELAVSGNPAPLVINAATAGSAPTSVSDSATSYDITTNEANRKMTAAIDANMPAGVTLTANLTAPTGGTSSGAVTLNTTAADVVTGISTLNETAKGISYQLSATSAAGTVASATRTVTFTITAGL